MEAHSEGRTRIFRIIAGILLLIAVCGLPLYISIPCALFCLFLFKNFYELIVIAFVGDALYGVPLHHFASFPYVMTLGAIVLVLASVWLRRHLFESEGAFI